MNNKKGFTLVEVLAVIVILGLMSVIIVPKVINTVNDSEKKSYEASVNNLVNSLNSISIDKKANLISFEGCSIDFDNDVNTCTDLDFSGELPTSGSITVDRDGNVNGIVVYENNGFQIINNEVVGINIGTEFVFDYTGGEQTFKVVSSGYYKLETWGAQGGCAETYIGGYGGYSAGEVFLENGNTLYINVGGKGHDALEFGYGIRNAGGYNGGGYAYQDSTTRKNAGGGGATHVALKSGLLSSLENDIDKILIVSGGGSGVYRAQKIENRYNGNSGGGYIGGYTDISYAGTQTSGYRFGQAGSEINSTSTSRISGGGGGFYGGIGRWDKFAGGGSGYIGNQQLKNKVMYCYQCDEANGKDDDDIRTIATENVSETPISNYAKIGNGFAKITYLGESID